MIGRFFGWLRRVLGRPEQREVLRLAGAIDPATGRSADHVREAVARKGPLKPHHRREIIRDERLMPKPARRLEKRTAVMTAPAAERLFGNTLRTANREHRTLATDAAQLARYGLPRWESEVDIAAALGIALRELRSFATHRERDRAPHYLAYAIPKRSGGMRVIHAPKRRLKRALRALNTALVAKLPVSEHAHGFVTGRSVATGAAPHVGKRILLRLDLQDFFPSVTSMRVRGLLIALGYNYTVAATLATLVTEAPRQPVDVDGVLYHVPVGPRTCVQGAPTSPGLCNAIVLRMDRRLAGLARTYGFVYTRYADDLTFSGDSPRGAHQLRRAAERVIAEEGFRVNAAKTRLMRDGGPKTVTGVTVNAVLGLSRQRRREIRAMIHQAKPADAARVQGLLAWVHMLNPAQAAALRKATRRG